MGIYSRFIGPKLVSCLCSMDDIMAERERIVPLASGEVLEIGMGPGLNLPLYNPLSVTKVIGVDPNDAFLHLGETRHRNSRVPLEILHAPAEALPLMDCTIDTAVITYTLCTVEDPHRALREVRRVLKPEGKVLFLEHGLSPEEDVARWQRRLNPIWRSLAVGCNLTRPVAELLQQAGFSIRDMEEYYLGGAPRVLSFHCRGIAQVS
ncbi:class I SAM-dependent methyltransferase [Microvirga makkahensis]|uniref:Methyltransferase domain-containing protein n=1 Tax=Microvirga makkahensis TaxID=1128670 RepID=A0A7X3MNR1_9HYPH|nr:class I SAM-dependent methyltransferase [Microvirga makkahensis]MXQ10210.1 methyltransferase domain-containing protein [Microvirga makkahensis]